MAKTRKPKRCPKCGHDALETYRGIGRFSLGVVILFVSLLLAIPTLGFSLAAGLWGIFLTSPRQRCPQCGWDGPKHD